VGQNRGDGLFRGDVRCAQRVWRPIRKLLRYALGVYGNIPESCLYNAAVTNQDSTGVIVKRDKAPKVIARKKSKQIHTPKGLAFPKGDRFD